jgi:hypothetical protein
VPPQALAPSTRLIIVVSRVQVPPPLQARISGLFLFPVMCRTRSHRERGGRLPQVVNSHSREFGTLQGTVEPRPISDGRCHEVPPVLASQLGLSPSVAACASGRSKRLREQNQSGRLSESVPPRHLLFASTIKAALVLGPAQGLEIPGSAGGAVLVWGGVLMLLAA